MAHKQKKKNQEMLFLESSDVGVTISMFQELKEILPKELKENMKMISHQIHNINKEADTTKESNRNFRVQKYNHINEKFFGRDQQPS